MSLKRSGRLVVALTLILLLVSWGGADARRPRTSACGAPDRPDISLITSRTPSCYRPQGRSTVCLVNWGSIQVSTVSPQTIVSMTLTIDNLVRANYQGYFQSAMNIVPRFHGDGFQVPCGQAGVDGTPGVGHRYEWSLRALDSEGLKANNEGTVTCPALGTTHVFLPTVRRQ